MFDLISLFSGYHFQTIDIPNEVILLDGSERSLGPNDLKPHISDSQPQYHFYLFKHTHEGDYSEDIGELLYYTVDSCVFTELLNCIRHDSMRMI